ncbi:hypothetical protein SB861_29525 [Paraburkholderia sp. SIMBA_049]
MKKITKALLSIVLTSTMVATEVSAAPSTAPREQLDVSLYKDGHQIIMKRSYISDEIFGQQPSAMSSGTEVGYETCTKAISKVEWLMRLTRHAD